MLTRRDLAVAVLSIGVTCGVLAAINPTRPIMGSTVFHWDDLKPKPNAVGEVRTVVSRPTATLQNLEIHITTLNPGQQPHEPHRHPNEELLIIRQGTLETLSNGVWTRVGPGSIIFNGSNQLHGLRNVGTEPAIYHVINVQTAATPAPLPATTP